MNCSTPGLPVNHQLPEFTQTSGGSDGKASAYYAGDLGSIPGSGISPGEENGNPIQYSYLENPTEEPGRLQSMGSQRVGHNWATELNWGFPGGSVVKKSPSNSEDMG